MALKDLLEDKALSESGDMGMDGGAAGAGLSQPPEDPGTSAWQRSVKMNMELNAKKRRN